jgi:hypothetical protein
MGPKQELANFAFVGGIAMKANKARHFNIRRSIRRNEIPAINHSAVSCFKLSFIDINLIKRKVVFLKGAHKRPQKHPFLLIQN